MPTFVAINQQKRAAIMLTENDLRLLNEKGISEQQLYHQLNAFKTGFPYLEIKSVASIDHGITALKENETCQYVDEWEKYLQNDCNVVKFVPASGAASRMFKDLFEFLDSESEVQAESVRSFFDNIHRFAFYGDLNKACEKNLGKSIDQLLAEKSYKPIVSCLLKKEGLNYGSLPKGLLKFHTYPSEQRTPFVEHLVEGALYANNLHNRVNIHYTVSHDHLTLFKYHLAEKQKEFEDKFGVTYNVSFSEQKASTDTVAADADNNPFRNEDGSILFRPGGHGALIENLNDIDADIIFIKNIDNVVPDKLKAPTVHYKKTIAGFLVHLQKQIFSYLQELENEAISDAKLQVIQQFSETRLNNHMDSFPQMTREEKISYLKNKLNRPTRVCGMVKNEGEPGGGPFLTVNKDGSYSPQILESSQIKDKSLMSKATHFNPVDLVCAVKDYKGNKFDLTRYVDPETGFISNKSKNGKELKALELPGLWNGAMSDWNTIFLEVPAQTFNPVKTVNDLLRPEHQ